MGEEKKELGERLCGEMTRADDLTGVSAGARLSGDLGRFFPFGARLFDHTHTHREDGTGVVVCTHPLARAARLGEKGDGVIGQYLVFFFFPYVYILHIHTHTTHKKWGWSRAGCQCCLFPNGVCVLAPPSRERRKGGFRPIPRANERENSRRGGEDLCVCVLVIRAATPSPCMVHTFLRALHNVNVSHCILNSQEVGNSITQLPIVVFFPSPKKSMAAWFIFSITQIRNTE